MKINQIGTGIMSYSELKTILQDISSNTAIMQDEVLRKAIVAALKNLNENDNSKVIVNLKQALNIYSLSHHFQLPKELASLQVALDKPDKWSSAGITGSLTNL
ncbi:hypothetical protein J2Z60_001926 [Lactobacillus colini]|uniref:Bacteriocin immunity protein n=1 Tax=Lactobacillus colini TaxID=1819254 RepID=A0ABS4MGB8_9LACO|nr:bacteriocin immunity protein [Lactobacillus colini]MBP2058737.1 hypothetical protein [Lactobacillus colini]